jgi:signal peptidase I
MKGCRLKSTPANPLSSNFLQRGVQFKPPAPLKREPPDEPTEELVLSSAELENLMRQVLSRGSPFRFHARGMSMAPFIQDGEAIFVAPLRQNQPGLGDVMAFIHPQTGRLVVHRVVGKHGRAYLMRGDNANGDPDEVSLEYLLGKVTQVERKGRQVRLGLGPERYLIALCSRAGLLLPLLRRANFIGYLKR